MSLHMEIKARQMIGQSVVDPNGDVVGTLEDLVIEPERGMIVYIVLELATGRRFSVPYHAVRVDGTRDHRVKIQLDRGTLERAARQREERGSAMP